MIAMAVFTDKSELISTPLVTSYYGFSFILGWCAFGLEVVLVPVSAALSKVSEYSVIP